MIFSTSMLIYLAVLGLGCLIALITYLPKFQPFRGALGLFVSGILAVLILRTCLQGIYIEHEKLTYTTFAEVDSELLLKEFIFAEAQGSRTAEELETITSVYSRAFDMTLNGLAIEKDWVIIPKSTAIIGKGKLIDATEEVRTRLENTLEQVGYVYLPPASETEVSQTEGINRD